MGIFHKKPGELLLKKSKALSQFDREEGKEQDWQKHRDLYIPRKKNVLTAETLFSPEYTTGQSGDKSKLRLARNKWITFGVVLGVLYLIGMFLLIVFG